MCCADLSCPGGCGQSRVAFFTTPILPRPVQATSPPAIQKAPHECERGTERIFVLVRSGGVSTFRCSTMAIGFMILNKLHFVTRHYSNATATKIFLKYCPAYFVWVFRVGSDISLWATVWDLSVGNFRFGMFVWANSLGSVRLGSFD